MNREDAKNLLPIIQAFADGKEVQWQESGKWRTAVGPSFCADFEWRIKPEPREIWVNEYKFGSDVYYSKEAAKANLMEGGVMSQFREVID